VEVERTTAATTPTHRRFRFFLLLADGATAAGGGQTRNHRTERDRYAGRLIGASDCARDRFARKRSSICRRSEITVVRILGPVGHYYERDYGAPRTPVVRGSRRDGGQGRMFTDHCGDKFDFINKKRKLRK